MLCGCDDIKENERYIELDPVDAQRTVLLEEYTGQFCVNCPEAHRVIEALHEQYPSHLVTVSIHAGGDAFSLGEGQVEGLTGLRIDEGEEYARAAGVASYPSGIVDRRSAPSDKDTWSNDIRRRLAEPASVEITLTAYLDPIAGLINISSSLLSAADYKGRIQLWIVESGIRAPQLMPDGSMEMDYVHNHVFRASVNGHDGEAITLSKGVYDNSGWQTPLKPAWTPARLSVVAFVYGDSGVENAAIVPVTVN